MVQVEPDRWYYHCDRLGMLVWQDMPRCRSFSPIRRLLSLLRNADRLLSLAWQLKVSKLCVCMRSMYWEDPFSQGESYRAPAEKVQFEAEITRHIEVWALSAALGGSRRVCSC